MNRYYGNSGRMERLPERVIPPAPPPPEPPPPPPRPIPRPAPELSRLLRRFDPRRVDRDDLILLAILWLLYRESGERELLIVMGAMILL